MIYSRNWLDIANRALVKTGNQQIENFTDGADNVNYINALLPEAVESVAALYPWRCMTHRISLAPSVDVPEFGFTHAFPLPTDFARIVEVDTGNAEWKREAGKIVTNSEYCNLVYLKLPDEPLDLIPSVRELITIRLAYNIVQTTTSNSTLLSQLNNEFQSALLLAEREDTQGEEDITEYTEDDYR